MSLCQYHDQLVKVRRELHRFPEEGWTEFWTTATIVEKLRGYGFKVLLGDKVVSRANCLGRNETLVAAAIENARARGVSEELLAEMNGLTGCVAVWDTGRPGPVLGMRFDIDCVCVQESDATTHRPAQEGWASERKCLMHACGHDSHASMGLGVAHWVADHAEQLCGKVKIVFQPAEEGVRGATAVAASGIVDDVDNFLSSHIGVICNSGEIVTRPYGLKCTTKFDVTFTGKPAHAGLEPNAGRNALAAACHAVTQLLGISRHGAGQTMINIGKLTAGEGRNVIPVNAKLVMEVRGATTPINEYMCAQVHQIIEGVAKSFDVAYGIEKMGEALDLTSDLELVELLESVAKENPSVKKIVRDDDYRGCEDVSMLVRRVQAHGGKALFFGLGTDRPAGHHQAGFDINEDDMDIGVELFTAMIEKLNGTK